jgi:hypothetical protein
MGKGRVKEGSKQGEYGWCTFYTRVNIEFLKETKVEGRKIDGMNQFEA